MMSENLKFLITKLKEKTSLGQAIWKKTSNDTEFKLEFIKGAVTIDKWENEFENFIDIHIINENGEEVEGIKIDSRSQQNYLILEELYEIIKKNYYKIDETFKSILDELDSEKIIGKSNDDFPF